MRYSRQTHNTVRRWTRSLSAPITTICFVLPSYDTVWQWIDVFTDEGGLLEFFDSMAGIGTGMYTTHYQFFFVFVSSIINYTYSKAAARTFSVERLICRGQQRKCWMDNIKEWTSLPTPELLTNKGLLQKRPEEDSCWIHPSGPPYDPVS